MCVCVMVYDNVLVDDFIVNIWLETNEMNVAL